MGEYAKRDAIELEPYYIRHVSAMTSEGLHSKSDIAKELAYRDKCIADLELKLRKAQAEIEAMRPTFEQLKARHDRHKTIDPQDKFGCPCLTCQMWRDYEARKPK
jgi:predicted RNase H-like nuclease (RuvC/YqgF family)